MAQPRGGCCGLMDTAREERTAHVTQMTSLLKVPVHTERGHGLGTYTAAKRSDHFAQEQLLHQRVRGTGALLWIGCTA